MKWLVLLLIVLYLGNAPIMSVLYPDVSIDWKQYIQFWYTRSQLYEIMFMLFCTVIFYSVKEQWVKSLTCFLGILVTGSVVDKCIFGFYQYLYSDFILIGVAFITSFYVYGRAKKSSV